ncbi:ABC transporter substrate-binding protein [Brevibacterium paucivorans]|uniref:ABC transporter substrate-binding protein n=1 Tax=Brevibacterium paucivorans TaxID=170994 RepID=UPI00321BD163
MGLRKMLAIAVAGLLTLSGCGARYEAQDTTADQGGESISITDSRGKTVTLDGPAEKVVTLEWSVTEYAVALGVNPVGVADPKGYAEWDPAVPLQNDPKDVGIRTEPSVDAIAALEPDLILADVSSIPDKQMATIEKIAPVAVFNNATTDGLIDLLKENQKKVGTLTGKDAEAKKLAEDYDATIEECKRKIADANKEGTPVVYTFPSKTANTIDFRMHGPGSGPGIVAKDVGLSNAWSDSGDNNHGISNSDVEGLTSLSEDAHVFYYTAKGGEDPIAALNSNGIWKGLGVVKNKRVHKISESVWPYGGTKSLEQMAKLYVDTVTR